jgi:RPA family protein
MSVTASNSSTTEEQQSDELPDARQHTAVRATLAELSRVTETYQDPEGGDKAPKFAVLPSGELANRIFVIGVVTDISVRGNSNERVVATVATPETTMTVTAHATYQQDAAAVLRDLSSPEFVAIHGKVSVYEADGETQQSITAHTASTVSETERARWNIETANATLDRLTTFDEDSQGGELALEAYDDVPKNDLIDAAINIAEATAENPNS